MNVTISKMLDNFIPSNKSTGQCTIGSRTEKQQKNPSNYSLSHEIGSERASEQMSATKLASKVSSMEQVNAWCVEQTYVQVAQYLCLDS